MEGFAEAAIPKEYLSALDEYRQATHPKGRLRGEGKLFATLRLVTHSPAMWIRTGGTPDPSILVYSMTKHRETISLEIVSLFLPGDTKGGRAFRHTATHDEFSCRVDSTFPGAMLQVSLALERKADELFATLRLTTHTPAVWLPKEGTPVLSFLTLQY
ncbi:MAG: hypothetical protein NHB14_16590 [Desulfosporosinus sp.]|nr:hypothetical protein [Desulfosporosinus sp.]